FAGRALELSAELGLPVLLRPTATLCHARQNLTPGEIHHAKRSPQFNRRPERWAATPKHRLRLHQELNRKLLTLAEDERFNFTAATGGGPWPNFGIVASGCAWALVADLIEELPESFSRQFTLYKVDLPYPLSRRAGETLLARHQQLLVIEESMPVIEFQLGNRGKISGRLNGLIADAGALTPELVRTALHRFCGSPEEAGEKTAPPEAAPGKRPSLCPGCPHRSSFYALKKALPQGLYAGDIGCYTLGINLQALDTCLCMGASISQAGAFYRNFARHQQEIPPIAAIIGDSTFFHSGIPALVNARWEDNRFVLLLLDNSTTAMTGNQPTPADGLRADDSRGPSLPLESLLAGCGLTHISVVDPYNRETMISELKKAEQYTRSPEGGIAAVIARRGCLMIKAERRRLPGLKIVIDDTLCNGCGYCIKAFECPALIRDEQDAEKRVTIDQVICVGCGQCLSVCPQEAIKTAAS
ncbi:MAG: indolepyruvate ferredoxin oxidoreductase subunit alpha, partial [Deltaproteobacteria bacterium]|nr:indolepyruvate ferredoxin oxidoreductase subunit alpha [Deltaproteobacteria bacterium]